MTTNQTIDGVPGLRDLLERIAKHCEFWHDHAYLEAIQDIGPELRALLDADTVCKGSMLIGSGCGKCRNCKAEQDDQPASDHKFYTAQLQARAARVLGLDPENTSWFEVVGEMEKSAAQPQGKPVALASRRFEIAMEALNYIQHFMCDDAEGDAWHLAGHAQAACELIEQADEAEQPAPVAVNKLGTHHVLGAIHNVEGFPGVTGFQIKTLTDLLNSVITDK